MSMTNLSKLEEINRLEYINEDFKNRLNILQSTYKEILYSQKNEIQIFSEENEKIEEKIIEKEEKINNLTKELRDYEKKIRQSNSNLNELNMILEQREKYIEDLNLKKQKIEKNFIKEKDKNNKIILIKLEEQREIIKDLDLKIKKKQTLNKEFENKIEILKETKKPVINKNVINKLKNVILKKKTKIEKEKEIIEKNKKEHNNLIDMSINTLKTISINEIKFSNDLNKTKKTIEVSENGKKNIFKDNNLSISYIKSHQDKLLSRDVSEKEDNLNEEIETNENQILFNSFAPQPAKTYYNYQESTLANKPGDLNMKIENFYKEEKIVEKGCMVKLSEIWKKILRDIGCHPQNNSSSFN